MDGDSDQVRRLDSQQGGHSRLSRFLSEHETGIVELWVEMVADAIASHSVDRAAILDSIRRVLAHLAERLVAGDEQSSESARDHGEQRFHIGFHLAAMTREFALILQAVERTALGQNYQLSVGEYGALARHVTASLGDSVQAYVEEQRAERARLTQRHFGFMAHELRNPVQTMALALAALEGNGDSERALGVLRRGLGSLSELLDGSLVAARAGDTGEITPEPEPTDFDLAELVRSLVADDREHAAPRGIELRVEAPDTLPVHLDRVLMRSIVSNLVRNAIKFSHDGGAVTVRVRSSDGDRVLLEVEDRCGGLSEGAIETMFEPFAQMNEDRTGFGLGLAITRQAVEAHRGHIQVHDVENGCVFIADLPRRVGPDDASAPTQSA